MKTNETVIPVKNITFEKVSSFIERMGLEENVKTALLNKAKSVPPGSLEHFLVNIHVYISNLTRDVHGKTD